MKWRESPWSPLANSCTLRNCNYNTKNEWRESVRPSPDPSITTRNYKFSKKTKCPEPPSSPLDHPVAAGGCNFDKDI